MFKLRLVTVAAILLTFVTLARAQDNAPELLLAHGMVDKADKETLIVIPRQPGGRCGVVTSGNAAIRLSAGPELGSASGN